MLPYCVEHGLLQVTHTNSFKSQYSPLESIYYRLNHMELPKVNHFDLQMAMVLGAACILSAFYR